MLAENHEGSAESHIEDLFGPPPLIKGEDAARYWRLHAAVTYEIKPETVLAKILVREFVDKLWQQQRYKLIIPIRAAVEHPFGVIKRSYAYRRVRCFSLARNVLQLELICLAMNLRRAVVLTS